MVPGGTGFICTRSAKRCQGVGAVPSQCHARTRPLLPPEGWEYLYPLNAQERGAHACALRGAVGTGMAGEPQADGWTGWPSISA